MTEGEETKGPGALLGKYRGGGSYADCYFTEVSRTVSQAEYVEAFYTTAVFKLERLLLARFVARPSSDAQARELASGRLASFAAWNVETREADQLLLCDMQGRTRSWLMTVPLANSNSTRLYCGSVVVPASATAQARRAWVLRSRHFLASISSTHEYCSEPRQVAWR
jgi:hypothetical protein